MLEVSKRLKIYGAVATASSLVQAAAIPLAQAQDEPRRVSVLEEIVVTATKREELLREVPISVTALDTEALLLRQNLNLGDMAAQVPGFSVEKSNPGLTRVVLRGQNAGAAGASVAVLVDDVPFSFAYGVSNGSILTADIDPYDLARVEVLRGPQGTLYGATAQGGIVKYVTKRPDMEDFSGSLEVGAQSIDSGDTGGSVRGFVNVPISDTLAIRASGFSEEIPGYIDNSFNGDTNVNEGTKHGGRVSLLYQPTSNLSMQLAGFYQNQDFENATQVNVVGAIDASNPPPNQLDLTDGLSFFAPTPTANELETYYTYLDIDYQTSWANITSATGFGEIKSNGPGDASGALLAPGFTLGTFLQGVYGQPVDAVVENINTLEKFSQEIRVSSLGDNESGAGDLDWQFGVFYTKEEIAQQQFFRAYPAGDLSSELTVPLPLGGADVPGNYEEISAFGEITYYITPNVDISIGGRYSDMQQDLQVNFFNGFLTTGGAGDIILPQVDTTDSAFTFSVAPRWRISDDSMVYARIASGFRPGGPQIIPPGAPADFPTDYTSDETLNYEVGFRTLAFDGRFSVDVAAYLIDWTDIQIIQQFVSPTSGANFNVTGNGGEAESKGVEWSFNYMALDGLNISVVGSWIDATLQEDAPTFGGVDGDFLPFVPELSNTLNIDYTWPVFSDFDAFVGGSLIHRGEQYTGFSGSPLVVSHQELPSYETFNAQFGVRSDKYFVQLNLRNITDERALTTYSGGGSPNLQGIASIIQPRTLSVRLGINF